MSKLDLGEVHAAIMSGFDEAELTKLLRFKLGIRFRDVVGNVGFDEAVTKLLDHLDQLEGPLVKLVKEMSVARPLNSKVQAVYAKYSTELFSDAWRNEGRRSHPKSKCSVYNLRQETPEISQKSPSNEYYTEHFT